LTTERIRQAAAAREMVEDAFADDYNGKGRRRSIDIAATPLGASADTSGARVETDVPFCRRVPGGSLCRALSTPTE
jgi:hypothetical protein